VGRAGEKVGWRCSLGCGKRKRKEKGRGRDGPAGLKRDSGKGKVFNLNSNSIIRIQTDNNNKTIQRGMNAQNLFFLYLFYG